MASYHLNIISARIAYGRLLAVKEDNCIDNCIGQQLSSLKASSLPYAILQDPQNCCHNFYQLLDEFQISAGGEPSASAAYILDEISDL